MGFHYAKHMFCCLFGDPFFSGGLKACNRRVRGTAISACGKCDEWQQALQLFATMPDEAIAPDVVGYTAAT